jgi:pilus assembly protein Flp/PilA
LIELFTSLIADESGATAIEYALIASFVSMAAVGGMSALGLELKDLFTDVSSLLDVALTKAGF